MTVENEKKSHINDCKIKDVAVFFYDAFGDAEGLAEGEGDAAFSREALMALNSTMEVYLLSSEYVIFSSD